MLLAKHSLIPAGIARRYHRCQSLHCYRFTLHVSYRNAQHQSSSRNRPLRFLLLPQSYH